MEDAANNITVESIRRTTKVRQVIEEEEEKNKGSKPYEKEDLVPSGSTLLNCACSDIPWGAFALGSIVTIPGTSQGGKTVLIWDVFAQAVRAHHLKGYEFYYDDVEQALEIDIPYLFGQKTADAVKDPPLDHSNTIQDFKGNILTLSKKDKSFIYALDSLDALSSDEELEKEFKKALAMAKSDEAAQKIAGSFGMEKAKMMGQALRMIKAELERTKSVLLVVQQLRQNTNRASPFSPKYITSGGEAPYFYSSHQVWLTKGETLKSKGRKIGSETTAKVTKNKLTGKQREVRFDIYYDYGIDDISSCVNFLVEEDAWKKDKQSIVATELDLVLPQAKLIKAIEEQGLEKKMKRVVGKTWNQIEETLRLGRRSKYD